MRYSKPVVTAAMSALLIGPMAGVPAAQAASSESPTGKEEVVYVMADASGEVDDVEVVNILPGGSVTDYGDYSQVKPLNTTDEIVQDGDEVTFTSDAQMVYYQGTMRDKDIPWDISIRYFLDGEELAPTELAGKSGALEIRLSISKNEGCEGNFYEGFALQAAFKLDAAKCENIVADGATIANAGDDKQVSYTVLPGKGLDASIYADVEDFEMDAATVNGVRLSLDVDVDDTELTDKVDELTDGVEKVDDGASKVNDGAEALSEAVGTLDDKVGELEDGVGSLADGAGELSGGLVDISGKNDELTSATYAAYEGLCSAAGASLNEGLAQVGMEAVALTPENYAEVLTSLLDKLDSDAVYQQAYQAARAQVTEQVRGQVGEVGDEALEAYVDQAMASDEVSAQLDAAVQVASAAAEQVRELKGRLDSYAAFYQGLLSYTGAVGSAADGAGTLSSNMETLRSNTGTLRTGVGELSDAASELHDGTQELVDGTAELADKTSDMGEQVDDKIDSMAASISGSDVETGSFASERNTEVKSVQFVIKTAAIEKEEAAVDAAPEEATPTFWQKLLGLFGLG